MTRVLMLKMCALYKMTSYRKERGRPVLGSYVCKQGKTLRRETKHGNIFLIKKERKTCTKCYGSIFFTDWLWVIPESILLVSVFQLFKDVCHPLSILFHLLTFCSICVMAESNLFTC